MNANRCCPDWIGLGSRLSYSLKRYAGVISGLVAIGVFPIAVNAQIHVASYSLGTIQNYSPAGSRTPVATIGSPQGLAVHPNGTLHVVTGSTVQRVGPTGGLVEFASGLNFPKGIAFDAAGNLFVANSGDNTIQRITPSGVRSLFARTGAGSPYGVAFDASGFLYVSKVGTNTVDRISPDGASVTVFASANLNSPIGLAFDSGGNLYVANHAGNTLYKFTPAGLGSLFASRGLDGPWGLAVDGDGNVYAANFNDGTVQKYTPTGANSLLAGGQPGATGVAILTSSSAPPVITTQPQSQTIALGGSVTLSVVATGSAPLSYQWRVDGVAIPDPAYRGSSFTLPNVQATGTVRFSVVVSNAVGTVTSADAVITITAASSAPTITTQPQAQTVTAGANVALSVVAAGTAPLSYRWQKGGAAISGATAATLTLSNVQTSDAGNYTVVVTNSVGSITSSPATLVVNIAATAPTITTQPQNQTVAVGGSVNLSVVATGTAPLSYQWLIDGVPAGVTTSNLTLPSVQAAGTFRFSVVVSNAAGSVTSSTAVVTITSAVTAPRITTQPVAATVSPGGAADLTVTASGGNLSYQWQLNGANIPGATNATLALSNVQPAAVGDYAVVVSNSAGSITSNAGALSMIPARLMNLSVLTPIAPNDPLTVGTVIGGHGTSGGLLTLIRGVGPSLTPLGVGGALVDPKVDVFSGASVVLSNDNWGGTQLLNGVFSEVGAFPFTDAASRDAALLFNPSISTPPAAYTVQVSGVGTGSGTVLAELYDNTREATVRASTPRLINMSVLKQIPATGNLTAGFVIGWKTPKQVLVRAIGPTLGAAPFNVSGAMPNPKLTLFDRNSAVLATNDDWGGDARLAAAFAGAGAFGLPVASRDAALLVTLGPGNYTAQVSASTAAGAAAGGLALIEVYDMEGGAAPAIIAQPASLSAVAGSSAMFSVSAIGATGFQWQRLPVGASNWVNLPEGSGFSGTTTASLFASAAQSGDQFRAVVTNNAGVSRSNPVSLAVTNAPSAIVVAGFSAPTVLPLSLITLNATGLTPSAATYVEFLNSAGAVVAQISPVAVTATSLTVDVPALFANDGMTLAAGVLSARIGQFVGGGTVTSNTFTAAQVQAPPGSKSQPGAMTLALLQAELDQANSLFAALPSSPLESANTRAVLNSTIQSLQGWITNVQRAMSGGTSIVMLGTAAPTQVTLTQSELQAVDNLLVMAFRIISDGAASATTLAADDGRKRAAIGGNAFQSASGSFAQAGVDGRNSVDLAASAKQFMASLPEATSDLLLQLDGVLGYILASELAASGLLAGAPVLAAGNALLGVGALGYVGLNSLIGLTNASAFILKNTWPDSAVSGAIDRRNALLDAIAARSNPSTVGSAVLSELNGPAARGFSDLLSRPTDSTGDFVHLARHRRHGATGAVIVAPSGAIFSKSEVSIERWQIPPKDPADSVEVFDIVRNPYHYPLAIPFSVSVAPTGSSVFTGWRIFAPGFNSYRSFDVQNPNGSYQSAGRDPTIALQMLRGGYYVIATFDFAHTLTVGSGVVTAASGFEPRREAEIISGAEGSVERIPDPVRYHGANGVLSPPAYVRGQAVKLEARPNSGFTFASWSGDYTGTANPATIEITRDIRVTANFRRTATPPSAPTNLVATPGNQQVALTWNASTGATSYNVKRLNSGSNPEFTTISNQTGTSFTDTGRINGTTYHYVVTAMNSSGQSGNSNQVSATPTAPVTPDTGVATWNARRYRGTRRGTINDGGTIRQVESDFEFSVTNGAVGRTAADPPAVVVTGSVSAAGDAQFTFDYGPANVSASPRYTYVGRFTVDTSNSVRASGEWTEIFYFLNGSVRGTGSGTWSATLWER